MKNSFFYFFSGIFFVGLLLSSCAKQKNEALAKNYYKLAMLELSECSDDVSKASYKKSLHYLNQALEYDKQPRYLALKATLLFELGQHEQSCTAFDQALASCSNQRLKTEILNNYACLHAQKGDANKALKIWQALESNQHYLTPEVALVNQGRVFVQREDYQSAQHCLTRATKMSPNYLDAHYYRALVAYRTGDISLAKNELSTVLFLEPRHSAAASLLSYLSSSSSKKN